jgi:hypothetical protein
LGMGQALSHEPCHATHDQLVFLFGHACPLARISAANMSVIAVF